MGKAPSPPDPWETASAQGTWNTFTAQQNQAMNMIGQNTPWGSLDYQQTGMQTLIDPSGKEIQVPQYTANVNLTPEQRAIFEQTQGAQKNLAGIANEQSKWLGEYLNEPWSFDNQDAANWAYDLGAQRLDPRFEQERQRLETQLVNRGIRPGSAAYDAEMSRFGQTQNDAYNQLMLQGRGQAFNESLASRNQPLNELIGLMSGTQVQNPNASFAQVPQVGVGGVDYTGLVNQKYQAELGQHQSMMGGLFGLGSSLIGLFSDARLKTDIRRVGTLDNGLGVYAYRFKDGGPEQIGVMAQEVAEMRPEAIVHDPSGYMRVDYGKAVA